MKNHTGSIVAQDKKDRVAVLRTTDCNDKSVTESGKIRMVGRDHVRIGTWNVRTLWQTGKYQIMKHVLEAYKYDVIGLCEVRWTNHGEIDGGEMIWSGGETHERGVGMILSEKAKKALKGYCPVDDRLMYASFRGYPRDITVIVAYAPTTDHSEEEVEAFYEAVEKVMEETPKDNIKFLVGDWNAKIRTGRQSYEDVMGKYGVGNRNETGEMLLEFSK